MSAIAIIRPVQVVEQLRTRRRKYQVWTITWRNSRAEHAADVHYSSRRRAEEMARLCGAAEIHVLEAPA